MAQMTLRVGDDLLERIRAAAARHGRSMNDYVSVVLDAATDPDLAGDEAQRLRERLDCRGLLVTAAHRRQRPSSAQVAQARAAAGRGTPLSVLVAEER